MEEAPPPPFTLDDVYGMMRAEVTPDLVMTMGIARISEQLDYLIRRMTTNG